MSRLGRAWRELRKPDPDNYNALFEPFNLRGYSAMRDLRTPLQSIAASLERIDRYKHRPRNVWCQHPELHDMEAEGLQFDASASVIRDRRSA